MQAVQRIRINQAGVENKHWKRQQYVPFSSGNPEEVSDLILFRFIEAFTDPKVWVMAAFAAIGSVLFGTLEELLFTYSQKRR